MPGDHARLSPSAAHRWMECPGSVTLESTQPDRTSRYAEEGTILHSIIARALPYVRMTRKVEGIFDHLLNIPVPEPGIELPLVIQPEHIAALESCAHAFVMRNGCAPNTHAAIEQKVFIPGREDDLYGTADVIIVDFGTRTLTVIDWKFGSGVKVFATNNPQGMIYALGALLRVDDLVDIDRVNIVIHQPMIEHSDAWQLSADELRGWLPDLLAAAARTDAETTTYVDGDGCTFCRARAVCPALRATALSVARSEFAARLDHASPEQLAEAMRAIPRIESFCKAVEGEVLARLSRGEKVPGYITTEGRRSRSWADPAAAAAWAQAQSFGIAAFTTPELKTPAQVEALAKKAKVSMPPKLVEWTPGKLHVAAADSGRREVTSAQLDFKPLAEDDL